MSAPLGWTVYSVCVCLYIKFDSITHIVSMKQRGVTIRIITAIKQIIKPFVFFLKKAELRLNIYHKWICGHTSLKLKHRILHGVNLLFTPPSGMLKNNFPQIQNNCFSKCFGWKCCKRVFFCFVLVFFYKISYYISKTWHVYLLNPENSKKNVSSTIAIKLPLKTVRCRQKQA